ncbi:MAG: T9SS type A sorting domain-containing protein [Bacteroidia bacterium]
MKKIFTILAAGMMMHSLSNAQIQVTITLDPSAGSGALLGATDVHMHSGGAVDTNSAWSYVVGDWGDPNSLGGMTATAAGFEITIDPNAYYSQAGNGPVPTGENILRIGMVFRESGPCGGFGGATNNCAEQKDDNNSDIFVNLATTPPSSSWSGVTVGIASSTKDLAGEKLVVSAYPNPFAESLNISYHVADVAKKVNISVINMLGQTVAEVVNGMQEPGLHTTKWDATGANGNRVPVGTYFVRYNIDGKTATQKVVLNR